MAITFTDAVLTVIDRKLAALPRERGAALVASGNTIHHLVEDTSGRYTMVSWDISLALTKDVQAAELDGRGHLRGTVHSHPDGVPDPSDQDLRATARVLEENPHLDEMVVGIVTRGEPRPGDLPIGTENRMSVHLARRGPAGTCRVVRAETRVLSIARDLDGLDVDVLGARAIEWEGYTYLGILVPPDESPRALLVPETYPMAGPLLVDFGATGAPRLAHSGPWHPTAARPHQVRRILRASGERPPGFGDRTRPLVGRLSQRRVLVVGLGSVGTTIVNQLVRSGVETIVAVDPETVEGSNLARSTYEAEHVGMAKCEAIADLTRRINPCVEVTPVQASIAELDDGLFELCRDADLVVAATDDPEGQALLSHHAYWANRPLVSCALYRQAAAGEVVISVPEIATPCWSCSIGGGIGTRPGKDYGTGRLVGEVALGPPIHLVSLVASSISISLLSGPDTPAGLPLGQLLSSGRTVGIISTTPRWEFFDELFADLDGHQWAPQSIWARPERDLECPVCGDERIPPPVNLGGALNSILRRLRGGLPGAPDLPDDDNEDPGFGGPVPPS